MKKLSIFVAFFVVLLSLSGLCACGEKDGPTFAGVISEEIYESDEEAVQGFLKNEIAFKNSISQSFFEPVNENYQSERELSQEEIKELPLGTYAEGATSAERGTLSFECEYYTTKEMRATTFQNLKVSLCLMKYGEGVRYFVLPPEEGDTLTNSYFEFISYGCEEPYNFCMEAYIKKGYKTIQDKEYIVENAIYRENSEKELNMGEIKRTTYEWESGTGYYIYSSSEHSEKEGIKNESKGFMEKSFREELQTTVKNNSALALIQTYYLAPCCFTKTKKSIELNEGNGSSIDICLQTLFLMPIKNRTFSVEMQKDHILEIRLGYEIENREADGRFESYMKKSDFGKCKVEVPQEIVQAPENR